jgi:hypothetical protein
VRRESAAGTSAEHLLPAGYAALAIAFVISAEDADECSRDIVPAAANDSYAAEGIAGFVVAGRVSMTMERRDPVAIARVALRGL